MLVLTRQLEEEIVIGDNIRLKIVAIGGNHVRLGISAPSSVAICRGELYDEVSRQNEAATAATPEALARLVGQRRDSGVE